jgi:hypothetical protein
MARGEGRDREMHATGMEIRTGGIEIDSLLVNTMGIFSETKTYNTFYDRVAYSI